MKFPLLIIAMSLLTHLLFFGQPKAVVFDEVYMGNFVSSYSQSRYYFDIHPPLAKILDHIVGKSLSVDYGDTDFSLIGNNFSSDGITYLRLLPLLAGILLPLIVYFICKNLFMSDVASFTVGLLLSVENSLVLQSRFILFDSVLLFFGFLSILLYLLYIKDKSKYYFLVLSGLFSAMAFSVKWTGLSYPLLIIIMEIIRIKNFKEIFKFIFIYVAIGIVFYVSIFAIHFSYFARVGAESFFERFIQINKDMFMSNINLTATHPYTSKWYTWPLMLRSIFYWQDVVKHQYIYLIGNPLIYWLSTISVILTLIFSLIKRNTSKVINFTLIGYFVNFIPFIFIGRVMFLYHYEAALIFAIVSIGIMMDKIKAKYYKNITSGVLIFVCICLFIYFSPLTYGQSMTDETLANKMWLSSWR